MKENLFIAKALLHEKYLHYHKEISDRFAEMENPFTLVNSMHEEVNRRMTEHAVKTREGSISKTPNIGGVAAG